MLYTKKNADYLPVDDDALTLNVLKNYIPGGEEDDDLNEVPDEPGEKRTYSKREDFIEGEDGEPVLDEEDPEENNISDEDVEDIEWSDEDEEDNEDLDDPSKD